MLYERITKHVNTSKYFAFFIGRKIIKYTILKVSERVWVNLKQPEAEVQ